MTKPSNLRERFLRAAPAPAPEPIPARPAVADTGRCTAAHVPGLRCGVCDRVTPGQPPVRPDLKLTAPATEAAPPVAVSISVTLHLVPGVDYAVLASGAITLSKAAKKLFMDQVTYAHLRANGNLDAVPWGTSKVHNARVSPCEGSFPKKGDLVTVRGVIKFIKQGQWNGKTFDEYGIETEEGTYTFSDWRKELTAGSAVEVTGHMNWYEARKKGKPITTRTFGLRRTQWSPL